MTLKRILALFTTITCLCWHLIVFAAPNPQVDTVHLSNIAPLGKAYSWSGLTSSTATTNQIAQPGLNDGDITTDVDLQPNGDKVGAWESGGVIWAQAVSINSVDFINGRVTRDG